MQSNYKRLGDFIQEVNIKNSDLKVTNLIGVSIDKTFIKSVANTIGVDMANYKIIQKNQLACKLMSVGRDEKLPVDLYVDEEPSLVSSAYYVFEPKDKNELLPEYLKMWLFRRETDRYVGYVSGGDVRGGISWDTFCEIPIKVPSIAKQQEIIKEYHIIQNRIALNNQLIAKLEDTAQTIYKQWFVEGINIANLPNGWKYGVISDICNYSTKRVAMSNLNLNNYISTENMLQDKKGVTLANSLPNVSSVTNFEIGNILISNIRPYLKKIWFANFDGGCSNDVLCIVPKQNIPPLYLYQVLENDIFFDYMMAGSKGTKMPRGDKDWIMNYEIVIPSDELLKKFNKTSQLFQRNIQLKRIESQKLEELKDLLLGRMVSEN